MSITRDEVLHVARLSRLELSEEDTVRFTSQINAILEWMEKIRSLDTSGVEPTYHALDTLSNVFRKDEVRQGLPLEKALQNAPDRQGSFIRVPRIVEAEE